MCATRLFYRPRHCAERSDKAISLSYSIMQVHHFSIEDCHAIARNDAEGNNPLGSITFQYSWRS